MCFKTSAAQSLIARAHVLLTFLVPPVLRWLAPWVSAEHASTGLGDLRVIHRDRDRHWHQRCHELSLIYGVEVAARHHRFPSENYCLYARTSRSPESWRRPAAGKLGMNPQSHRLAIL